MKTIVVMGASTSSRSINRALAEWAASRIPGVTVRRLDLNAFEMPIYSIDREEAGGIPREAHAFRQEIEGSDGVVISLAEHNGSYAAAFKNVLDWTSRIDTAVWAGRKMLLLSTSPGGRGGASVMASAERTFPHLGAEVVATFSLPAFPENFDAERGITDGELAERFEEALGRFIEALGSGDAAPGTAGG